MFTTWELIYSQPQHRQSLPLPQNERTPHSISLYATALRIQYQISSAPSWSKDLNLALETFRLSVSRSVLLRQIPFLPSTITAIRRLAIIFFVPCVALSGLQPFTRNSLFDSSGTVGYMPELSIGIRLYCSSANYGTTIIQHQAVSVLPNSAANATGRSRTALNRNVLVTKEKYELFVFRDKFYTYLSIGTAGLEPAAINSLEHKIMKRLFFPLNYVPSQRA